jgi:predicted DNA-binding transcriptional regulator AlpA
MRGLPMLNSKDKTPKLITIDELAEILHLKKGTAYNRLCAGDPMPPSIQIGKKRLWLQSTVDSWLKAQEKDTNFSYQ